MVVDNLDYQESIKGNFPECAYGAILVITQNMQVGSNLIEGQLPPIEVGRMADDDADDLLCAFLDKDAKDEHWTPIPLEFLLRYSELQPSLELRGHVPFTRALEVLRSFSFITEAHRSGPRFDIRIHRLVLLVARRWVLRKGMGQEFSERALLTVADVFKTLPEDFKQLYLSHALEVVSHDAGPSTNARVLIPREELKRRIRETMAEMSSDQLSISCWAL
ncbi:hypothetical protein C8A03DRAFT_39485 [Achaetomium macrosporum]|uniref:Uncharacterized protein n=1 Tax=Achaetomium macrosporum TaxID=79813 RepID=A0AAN7H6D4_9PEZI|nr:hypothetical protein C8A03DRAFT_39485 [Achaetomium macrosporum]